MRSSKPNGAQQGPEGPLRLFTVSAIASGGLHALNLIGHHSESVEFADEVIPDLESLYEDTNLPDICAHKIEALIGLHRMDEASRLIEKAGERQKHSVHLARLKKDSGRGDGERDEAPTRAGRGGRIHDTAFRALDDVLGSGEGVLVKSGEEMKERKADEIQRRVGQLFLDKTKGHDPVLLEKALEELGPLESWAQASSHVHVHNDTLWATFLCLSGMRASSDAADALRSLRRNVEKRRAGIGDPL